MTKALLFYIVALWLLGQAIKDLMDAAEKIGYERGQTVARLKYEEHDQLVHRQP